MLDSDAYGSSSFSTVEVSALLKLLQHEVLYCSVLPQMLWLWETFRCLIFIQVICLSKSLYELVDLINPCKYCIWLRRSCDSMRGLT